MTDPASRRDDILHSIAVAAREANRAADAVTLVAVTKTRSMAEIEPLLAAGQRDFGESRVQEAQGKWSAVSAVTPDLRLHLIGRLQSNKAAEAMVAFDVVHSLDRETLLDALVAAAERTGRFLPVYVQVNIGEEAQKGGVAIDALPSFLDRVRSSPLKLSGLMAIPPQGVEPGPYFALLAKLARRHDVVGLSMGMSGDYRTAVKLGATAVRIGTALFED